MQNLNDGDSRQVSGIFARLAVVFCVLLMLGLMAFLWTRWARIQEPTTAVVVNGDPSLDGTKVAVTQLEEEGQSAQTSRPVEVALNRENGYRTAIFRYPGRYHVSVTAPKRQSPLWEGDVSIDRLRGWLVELPTVLTVIGDASISGEQVTVTQSDGRMTETQMLDKQNNERARFIVIAGRYTLTVTRAGMPVSEDEFTVEAHRPKQIDLRSSQRPDAG